MKIRKEHFEQLEKACVKEWEEVLDTHSYISSWKDIEAEYVDAPGVNDPKKRARWDLWYIVPQNIRYALLDEIRKYGATDAHVDTALKAIVKKFK